MPDRFLRLAGRVTVGLWRPATADALKVCRAIADDAAPWKRAAYGKPFDETYDQEGD